MVVEEKEMKSIRRLYMATSNEYGCNIKSYRMWYIGFGLHTKIDSAGYITKGLLLPHLEDAVNHRLYYTGIPLYDNRIMVFT
jgi:hypothetical protein